MQQEQKWLQYFIDLFRRICRTPDDSDIMEKEHNRNWLCSLYYTLGSPYSLFMASAETTHCLPNLQTSTPSTSFP